jgi:membrane protease YdiL (CAAX protease family)
VKRLWALLVALCAAGILLASPFLLAALRGVQSPMSPALLLALQALQTLLLCVLATYAGARFAPAAGLDAPWLRALAEDRSPPPAFASMAIEAAAVGSIAAVAVTALDLMLRASLPEAPWRPASGGFWMRASSAFYGGIVEEVLVRWGLLTSLADLGRRAGIREAFWPANVLSALVFGALHLPSVAVARIPLTGGIVAHVLLANGIAGVVFGWMFRRRGLEGAMIAHAAADVWVQAALPALLA